MDLSADMAEDLAAEAEAAVAETQDETEIDTSGLPEIQEEVVSIDEEVLDEEIRTDTAEPETGIPEELRDDIKSVLSYLDQLLESLPDEKIEEFAKSEYFGVYKKLFVELGLGE